MRTLFVLILLTVPSRVLKADPNNVNQCGQYNAYMGNLCEQDLEHEKKVTVVIPPCSDCNASAANLWDSTKVKIEKGVKGGSGSGETDSAQ